MNSLVFVHLLTVACVNLFCESPEPAIKLYVFDMGEIIVKDVSHWTPGINQGKAKTFACPAFLIRHPKGDLMWDTGLPDHYADSTHGVDSRLMTSYLRKKLVDQLMQINISPGDIEYVAFSHKHLDHIGNANLFKNATLILQREESTSLFGRPINPAVKELNKEAQIILDDDHDVFNDGSVIIKRTPGHTKGHQSLVVRLQKSGTIILSGDLYHFESNRTARRVPGFHEDKENTLSSMDLIEALVSSLKATLWIQHDIDQKKTIRHSPGFYE